MSDTESEEVYTGLLKGRDVRDGVLDCFRPPDVTFQRDRSWRGIADRLLDRVRGDFEHSLRISVSVLLLPVAAPSSMHLW